ncbi:MAG: hypothetical protein AMXMBFR48_26590 [Ignavibacteriales bacterium]
MRYYTIEITETLTRLAEIEAPSLEQALEKARDMYYDGEIVLNECDLVDTEFNRFERE